VSTSVPAFSILLSTLLTIPAFAVEHRLPERFEDPGACPFECCTYREWIVEKDTALYRKRDKRSPVVYRVKKGDVVTGVTGVVVTLTPGKAKVLKPTILGHGNEKVEAKPGELLYTLHYEGEGYWKLWFKGKGLE
jgi:hypothetical protein